ncbi:MAG: HTTM domain-containing protein [Flavobacteriales bacterium]|nr:HTTM domain-containing protein [Flavobacteriales bacterium]
MEFRTSKKYVERMGHAAPLAVFRIYFGMMMLAGIIRFWLNGWIEKLYLLPRFHFHYLGFEFVTVPGNWTYALFALCALSATGIMLGYRYRLSASLFFLSFTYIELMDKTTYLNHYYFISLVAFLLIFLPANRYFSIDTLRNPHLNCEFVPRWNIDALRLMLAIVYFYAGLAKLNSEWLFHAQPLRIWLPTQTDIPLLGTLFGEEWMLYAMSWGGAIYDLSIPFLLLYSRTRWFAFGLVVFFHGLTSILFPIGMFPYIMIGSTLLFFSDGFHQKIVNRLAALVRFPAKHLHNGITAPSKTLVPLLLSVFFLFQLLIPFRYLLYPGELFWTEEGYRFSWRVMLMEKAGSATFVLSFPGEEKSIQIDNRAHLTPFQEKQMSTQPDLILEYAHYLRDKYRKPDGRTPQVFVRSHVALNGRKSAPYIDPTIDLASEKPGLHPKKWILPFGHEIQGL